jgi:hypothetical protein
MLPSRLVKWTDRYIEMAYLLTSAGFSEQKQAEIMDVHYSTYCQWKKTHKEFKKAIDDGNLGILTGVTQSILKLALGFPYEEEVATYDRSVHKWEKTTIKKQRLPDPWTAMRLMSLKARDQGWSETQRISIESTANININIDTISTDILALLEKEAKKLRNVTDIEPEPLISLPGDAGDDN